MSRWRAQRVPLIALAAAVVAVAGVYLWLDVLPSLDAGRDRIVEAEQSAEVSGQTLTIGPHEWGEFDGPDGTRTLSIRLSSSGGADAGICGPFTLSDVDSGRVWLSSRTGLDVPYDEGESSCVPGPEAHRILLVFLLPDDVDGPFRLDVAGRDDDIVRFVVDP